MNFSSLGLAPELLQAIEACGYTEMTPVQEQAIVPARRGKDLLANAQTGTGKTAAFALPILQQMIDKPRTDESKSPRAIILTPTRELAEQLAETIGAYAQFLTLNVTAVYGGVKMGGQERKLKAGVDILIATPGRLMEHITQCNVELSGAEFVVLDEADRMLDMGFIDAVGTIFQHVAKKRQTLLFSATISPAVNELAHKILNNHLDIRVTRQNVTAETVKHVVYPVDERSKIDLFMDLLTEKNWFQILVFTSTKEQADRLLSDLKLHKVTSAVCHGDKSQGTRRRALADFKAGDIQVLIATEVAARGLDIQGLEYVLNFNLPYLAEDYVHRIGRAGRAGNKGNAISFVSREEERTLDNIERLIGSRINRVFQPGFEVSNRDALIKSVSKKQRPNRTNKSSQKKAEQSAPSGVTSGKAKKPAAAKSGKPAATKSKKANAPKKPKHKNKK
jgi:superfamily II DNA/RNA helicase